MTQSVAYSLAISLALNNGKATVTPGTYATTLSSGSTLELDLPSGATWDHLDTSAGNVSSAGASGNTPATVTYNGGGGQITAYWTDSSGARQSMTITFSG